jgi:hypothetical protein
VLNLASKENTMVIFLTGNYTSEARDIHFLQVPSSRFLGIRIFRNNFSFFWEDLSKGILGLGQSPSLEAGEQLRHGICSSQGGTFILCL